jgi:hypothetical protein
LSDRHVQKVLAICTRKLIEGCHVFSAN